MNVTLFKKILKKEALDCYNNALDSLYNNPFGEVNNTIKNDVIDFEIKQAFGRKAIAAVLTSSTTSQQLQIMDALICNYKNRMIKKIKEC